MMVSWSSVFSLTSLLVLAAGVTLGLVAGYLAFPAVRRAKLLRAQLDRLLQEHQDYKVSVDTHFRKTAELVGDMTRSYAAVYDHLAGGARTFCDGVGPETRLSFGPLPGALASPEVETPAAAAPPPPKDEPDFVIDGADHAADGTGEAGALKPQLHAGAPCDGASDDTASATMAAATPVPSPAESGVSPRTAD